MYHRFLSIRLRVASRLLPCPGYCEQWHRTLIHSRGLALAPGRWKRGLPTLTSGCLPFPQMMTQVEGQQKTLVHAIESLPGSGPLTALDQDLLLLKATSAATLSCLGECLSLLQQSLQHAGQSSHRPAASGKTSPAAARPGLRERVVGCARVPACPL